MAEEIDHLPSRSCFDGRNWPEGFEFPTCQVCNASTSQDEQVIALVSRMHDHPSSPAIAKEIQKYMIGVANNNREVFHDLIVNPIPLPDGTSYLGAMGPAIGACIRNVLPRWARAFHYRITDLIVPPTANIETGWFTNFPATSDKVPQEILKLFDAPKVPLRRNGKDLSSQFGYITRLHGDRQVSEHIIFFRQAFGAWMRVDLRI